MKFSEIPYFIITKYLETIGDYYNTDNSSYLIGGRKTIVVKGGNSLEFFVKDDTDGYKQVWMSTYSDYVDDNQFNFTKEDRLTVAGDLTTTYTDTYFTFNVYNVTSDTSHDVENGQEIYFRKDSPFHTWLEEEASALFEIDHGVEFIIRNYINYDKDFVYFGTVYSNSLGDDTYHVIHYNMQNFAIDAVPLHQQSDNFKELLGVNFDILYNELYGGLKDLINMIDPREINIDFLNYISSYWNFEIDDFETLDLSKREFVEEMINIVKKKGAYDCLHAIWKLVSNNNTSRFNIYERWHNTSLTGDITESDYTDYLSLEHYGLTGYYPEGAGDGYYDHISPSASYPTDLTDKTLSTYYIAELDLTDEPIHKTEDYIIKEEFIDKLVEFWEIVRPVIRVANYQLLLAPLVDASENWIQLYANNITPYLKSKAVNYTWSDYYIDWIEAGDSFSIVHNLDSHYLLVQVYTYDGVQIPSTFTIVDDNSITLDLDSIIDTAYVLIHQGTVDYEWDDDWWIVNHRIKDVYLLTQIRNNDDEIVVPDTIDVINYDRFRTNFLVGKAGVITADYLHTQTSPSASWTVNHELGNENILVQVYGTDGEKICPTDTTITDSNNVLLSFETAISGYSVVKEAVDFSDYSWSISTSGIETFSGTGSVPTSASGDKYTITHTLNTTDITVQVFNDDSEEVYPHDITFTDNDTIEIDLDGNVQSLDINLYQDEYHYYTYDETVVDHKLVQKYVITHLLDSSYNMVEPEPITVLDIINLLTTQSTGYINISSYDYLHTQSTASLTWMVNHRFNIYDLAIDVYDTDGVKIYPDSIQLLNEISALLTFSTAQDGYASVKRLDGDDSYTTSISASDSFNINHGLDSQHVIIIVYDENNNEVTPNTVQFTDKDNLTITFLVALTTIHTVYIKVSDQFFDLEKINIFHDVGQKKVLTQYLTINSVSSDPSFLDLTSNTMIQTEEVEGIIIAKEYDYMHTQSASASTWNITHDLGVQGNLINTYNADDEKIYPTSVTFDSVDTCIVVFDEAVNGYALIASVGNTTLTYSLVFSSSSDDLVTYDYKKSIDSYWSDDDYIYLKFDIPASVNMTITEMGIVDVSDTVIFLTKCSSLYKSELVNMKIVYKISKETI